MVNEAPRALGNAGAASSPTAPVGAWDESRAGAVAPVEVCYALPTHAWRACVPWSPDLTVGQVLDISGFYGAHPDCDVAQAGVGVNGRLATLQTQVHADDRVEIYRPLSFDPMVSRRRRAAHKARKSHGGQTHEQRNSRP